MNHYKDDAMFTINVGFALLGVTLLAIALVTSEVIMTGGKMLPIDVSTANVAQ
jgi:hypothetical protein